jgi:peptidoglycan hydrolase CwlO-like protein
MDTSIKNHLSRQDEILQDLQNTVLVLKTQAQRIGGEVETQNKMLDDLEDVVDTTSSKVTRTTKKIDKVSKGFFRFW